MREAAGGMKGLCADCRSQSTNNSIVDRMKAVADDRKTLLQQFARPVHLYGKQVAWNLLPAQRLAHHVARTLGVVALAVLLLHYVRRSRLVRHLVIKEETLGKQFTVGHDYPP